MGGGIGQYLSGKSYHPARLANQRRVYEAEQSAAALQREAENRKAEHEQAQLAELIQNGSNDPRDGVLKFMYSGSVAEKRERTADEEDKDVQSFRRRLESAKSGTSIVTALPEQKIVFEGPEPPQEVPSVDVGNSSSSDSEEPLPRKTDTRTTLERSAGMRSHRNNLTHADLAERHPILRNAPLQGTHVKNQVAVVKPFAAVVRNVRCMRCGAWGHASNDRECPMSDYNPRDFERQQREDPIRNTSSQASLENFDPEGDIIVTLTPREAYLLDKKLREFKSGSLYEFALHIRPRLIELKKQYKESLR